MKIIIFVFLTIELIAFIVLFSEVSRYAKKKAINAYNKILDRCVEDEIFRNKIASSLYFFRDMGPSVASFSIISIIITDTENLWALLIVFFVGIIMKEKSRSLTNYFYGEIRKRKERCLQEQ